MVGVGRRGEGTLSKAKSLTGRLGRKGNLIGQALEGGSYLLINLFVGAVLDSHAPGLFSCCGPGLLGAQLRSCSGRSGLSSCSGLPERRRSSCGSEFG